MAVSGDVMCHCGVWLALHRTGRPCEQRVADLELAGYTPGIARLMADAEAGAAAGRAARLSAWTVADDERAAWRREAT